MGLVATACAPGPLTAQGATTPPSSTAPPSISDTTPHELDRVTAYPGGWTGTAPITFGYQWRRCDTDGSACVDIPAATAATITIDATLVGATLRVHVVATNAYGSAAAESDATDVVGPVRARNTALPVITGEAVYGARLDATPGAWTGSLPIIYAYRWKRCDAVGAGCTSIAAATEPSYTVGLADAGSTLRVAVTATNQAGSAAATSEATAPVEAVIPFNTAPPAISDSTPHDGNVLTAYPGSWSGTGPISYSYRWQRCPTGPASCADIENATGSNYTVTATDMTAALVAVVTATNQAGATSAPSAPTAAVDAAAPVKRNPLPAISGAADVGATLHGSSGAWVGTEPIEFTYRWKRCNTSGGSCKSIRDADAPDYVVDLADAGSTIRLSVTATNAGGSASAASGPTEVIAPARPVDTAAPTISDTTPHDLDVLSAYPGSWWGTQPMTFSYQWLRCDALGASCLAIPGADAALYAVTAADIDGTVRVSVTASNAAGTEVALSAATDVVQPAAPVPNGAALVTGDTVDGGTLVAEVGSWTGTTPMVFTYRWMRCNAAGGGCRTITGQTTSQYDATSLDVNGTLRVAITATNAAGASSVTTPPSGLVVGIVPVATGPPQLTGRVTAGLTLSTSTGTWSGSTPIGYVVQWLRCDGGGGACAPIPGETSFDHALSSADVGSTVRSQIVATNPAGSTTVLSAASAVVAPVPPAIFADTFDGPDRLVTNEYAYYNPTHPDAVFSPDWELTSGSLFARGERAWSGVPDDRTPDATSSNGTDSSIFRLRTMRADFADVVVSLALRIDGYTSTPRTPETAYDGVHIWVRYADEHSLYAISVARRDGTVRIKKKCPGGPSNGGVYYDLTPSFVLPLPVEQWATFSVAAGDEPDGSVTLEVSRDGVLLRRVSDAGVGCAPITQSGRIGVRGDNAEFEFDDLTVRPF